MKRHPNDFVTIPSCCIKMIVLALNFDSDRMNDFCDADYFSMVTVARHVTKTTLQQRLLLRQSNTYILRILQLVYERRYTFIKYTGFAHMEQSFGRSRGAEGKKSLLRFVQMFVLRVWMTKIIKMEPIRRVVLNT